MKYIEGFHQQKKTGGFEKRGSLCASCHCTGSEMRLFGNVGIRLMFCFVTANCHVYGGLLVLL